MNTAKKLRSHLTNPTIIATTKPNGQAGFLSLPTWLLYLIGAVILVALGYGAIQQFRVWRWHKMLAASKSYIAQLEAEKSQAHYQGVRAATSRAVAVIKKRELGVDQKLKKLDGQKKSTHKQIQTMTPQQLKEAFANEGF